MIHTITDGIERKFCCKFTHAFAAFIRVCNDGQMKTEKDRGTCDCSLARLGANLVEFEEGTGSNVHHEDNSQGSALLGTRFRP